MSIQVFGDTLMHFTPGSGGIFNTYELNKEFTRKLVFGDEDCDRELDNLTLVNWAEKNQDLDLMNVISSSNSRPLRYKSESCCFGPREWSYSA